MSLEDDIRVLSGVSLFEDLSGEQLRLLAFGAERNTLTAGRELFHPGQNANGGFVVVSGKLDLFTQTPRGRKVVKQVGPGTLVGELALITETQRLTGAVAAEDVVVLRISRSLFRRMLEEYPETAARLHAEFSERLCELLDEIGALEHRFADK